MCILFEKGDGILESDVYKKIKEMAKNNLTRDCLKNLVSKEIFNYPAFYSQKANHEFFIYDLNIFETPKKEKSKIEIFLKRLEFNLNEINKLDEGDVVGMILTHLIFIIVSFLKSSLNKAFKRSMYHHHAILTGI